MRIAIMTVFVSLAFVSWIWSQRPIETPNTRLFYQSQEAIDAVQNQRLIQLESLTLMHVELLTQLQSDRNWLMGGIATIGGLFVVVQLLQAVNLRKASGSSGRR